MEFVTSWFADEDVAFFVSRGSGEILATLPRLMEQGKVRTVVDRIWPLAKAAEAMRHLETGRTRGKVIVTIE